MNKSLVLKPITLVDLQVLESWYSDEKSYFFAKPSKKWIQYIDQNKNILARKIELDGKIVGLFQIDIDEDTGSIAIIVSPKFRWNGYGKKILEIAHNCVKWEVSKLHAMIDIKNIVCIKLFIWAGYKSIWKDAHNLEIYEKKIM